MFSTAGSHTFQIYSCALALNGKIRAQTIGDHLNDSYLVLHPCPMSGYIYICPVVLWAVDLWLLSEFRVLQAAFNLIHYT